MKKLNIEFFNKNSTYQILKSILKSKCNEETIENIWNKAGENLEILAKKYSDLPKAEHMHVYNKILPRIAMYQALKEKMPKEEAMQIIEETIKISATEVGKKLSKITSNAFMAKVFMKLFATMTIKMFGEKSGFKQTFYEKNTEVLRFDINECPYCKYSKECNCEELIHTFCDSDIYCYGNLANIKFERTKTLGTGGECCDFKLSRENRRK